jgi:hypothetical protein
MWFDNRRSSLRILGLPEKFGEILLVLCLILFLSPYFSGSDFGILKIPNFSPGIVGALRIFGPIALVSGILLYLPTWKEPVKINVDNRGGPSRSTLITRKIYSIFYAINLVSSTLVNRVRV